MGNLEAIAGRDQIRAWGERVPEFVEYFAQLPRRHPAGGLGA